MICGSDNDAACVNFANSCLEQNKLSKIVKNIIAQDVKTTTPQRYGLDDAGIIITNPSYGKRLQEVEDLDILYQRLGEQLRNNFIDWEVAIFTGNPDSCRKLMLRPRKQYNFFNGTIPCKLLFFDIRRENFWRECL
jgi:23S rRNA (guanine2445-N2)-methyltransferase / 23S rRNA (guanine2069-N7)-methyltransferase